VSHAAFMRAIHAAAKFDHVTRLVYADWLEENGDPQRAEFIRVQCADDQIRRSVEDPPLTDAEEAAQRSLLNGFVERAQILLKNNWESLVGPVRRFVGSYADRVGEAWLLGGYQPDGWFHFRRGFVEELNLTAGTLLEHADELFRTAPLRHLKLWRAGAGVAAVAQLPHLAGVYELEFSDPWGELVRAEGMAALAASPHPGRLRSLNLARNDIADGGAVALAGAAWLAGLDTLNLRENGIGDAGVEALAASAGVSGLDTLDLGRNGITDRGLQALANSPYLTNLTFLHLEHNALTPASHGILAASPSLSRTVVFT
jgi:uncharacterized protein (TIGR02996 family)